MKNYQMIQILLADLQKQQRNIYLAIEDTNEIINSTTSEGYKKLNLAYLDKCKTLLVSVERLIVVTRNKLKCQGFDFGEIFSKPTNDIFSFADWFKDMIGE